jgi:hypothetical protein
MRISPDTLLALVEALKNAGWEIVQFDGLKGGVELTIIPLPEKEGSE